MLSYGAAFVKSGLEAMNHPWPDVPVLPLPLRERFRRHPSLLPDLPKEASTCGIPFTSDGRRLRPEAPQSFRFARKRLEYRVKLR